MPPEPLPQKPPPRPHPHRRLQLPVTSAVVASDLGISVSPASVLPGEDFTFSHSWVPIHPWQPSPLTYNFRCSRSSTPHLPTLRNGDDVLGGPSSGLVAFLCWRSLGLTPQLLLSTRRPATTRLYARCTDPRRYLHGRTAPVHALTVRDPAAPPTPTETISTRPRATPATSSPPNIENCPTGSGTQRDLSSPMSYIS